MEKNNSGITLLALVITIIVTLILAGISIGMISGNNGTINQATNAKMRTVHAQVYEQLQLEELSCVKESNPIIGYLQEKGIIGLEIGSGTGQYQVIVSSLLDNVNEIGTGTATTKNNVYMLEKQSDENADGEAVYKVVYYGKNQNDRTDLGTISGEDDESVILARKAIILKVNSGDDGLVWLPILCTENCKIDWGGDGELVNGNTTTGNNEFKVASIKNGRYDVAGSTNSYGTGYSYQYNAMNTVFKVTITGEVTQLGGFPFDREKLIEVVQWGETGLESIGISNCTNLVRIASPSQNSFQNMESFYGAFTYCTSLRSIPSDLFKNCPNVTNFFGTFGGCTALTNIPSNLFENCPNATDFTATFAGCNSLTEIPQNLFNSCQNVEQFVGTFANCSSLGGNASALWERVTNSANFIGTPDGKGCFYLCENLDNYETIPEYWRKAIDLTSIGNENAT